VCDFRRYNASREAQLKGEMIMNTQKVAQQFAKEPVENVGRQLGTRYADGGQDFEEYFESNSGKHVVVQYSHVDNNMLAHKSDGVVW
jgi:hypothetical protein